MKPLDISRINEKAPYRVGYDEVAESYDFVTDSGVHLSVAFDSAELIIHSGEAYQLIITNSNYKKSPGDRKVKDTILCIVEEFFEQNQALLYICETGDGKQRGRNRLFEIWIRAYERKDRFFVYFTSVMDDGVDNYAALIIRADHPNAAALSAEFTEVAQSLREK